AYAHSDPVGFPGGTRLAFHKNGTALQPFTVADDQLTAMAREDWKAGGQVCDLAPAGQVPDKNAVGAHVECQQGAIRADVALGVSAAPGAELVFKRAIFGRRGYLQKMGFFALLGDPQPAAVAAK